jgi:hypothetical protein
VHTPTSADDDAQNTPTVTDETQPTPTVTTKIHIDDDAKPKPINNAATPILDNNNAKSIADEDAKAKLLLANNNAKLVAEVDADTKLSNPIADEAADVKLVTIRYLDRHSLS